MNHLLVVDDSPVDRKLACSIIESFTPWHAEFAGNGVDAIEQMEANTPMAVLTDLQMPEMDGLELVRVMNRRFPTIPVILSTAYGSEEIAVEALVEGASDYVPKHRLTKDLPRALDGVLHALSNGSGLDIVAQGLDYVQMRYSIESKITLIPPLVDRLQQVAVDMGVIPKRERVRLARSLAEALRNAILHGCGEALSGDSSSEDKIRNVDISAELTTDEARFVIRDQGEGFNPDMVADPRKKPKILTEDGGRGLSLIRCFMDQVEFNRDGNEITLVKHRKRAEVLEPVALS